MIPITKNGTTLQIGNFPWKKEFPSCPETHVTVSYTDEGFDLHFVSFETNLRATETAPNTMVCFDSCMEMFMQFAPDTDPRYINIEINPNGAAYSAISYDRHHSTLIDPAYITGELDIQTAVFDDRWEIRCHIPVSYIKRQIPSYAHGAGAHLRGNFYKCGELTGHSHFGCWSNIEWQQPDFHRPEFFGDLILE